MPAICSSFPAGSFALGLPACLLTPQLLPRRATTRRFSGAFTSVDHFGWPNKVHRACLGHLLPHARKTLLYKHRPPLRLSATLPPKQPDSTDAIVTARRLTHTTTSLFLTSRRLIFGSLELFHRCISRSLLPIPSLRVQRVGLSAQHLARPRRHRQVVMADLYPTYSRQYQRQDSGAAPQYQLAGGSSISGIMYPPQLTAQTSVVDDQQQQQQSSPIPNEGSNSPVSQPTSSPKQESPTAQKTDGMPQQPAKPQATFLTKLYAYVSPSRSRFSRSSRAFSRAHSQSPRATRESPHDTLGSGRRAHHC